MSNGPGENSMIKSKDAHPKLFVLDTNVILHDSACLRQFEEHDIALPITVLEELDKFKKGNGDIHFHAREFLRTLDELTGDVLCETGALIGPNLGSVRVLLGESMNPRLKELLLGDSPDHRTLVISGEDRMQFNPSIRSPFATDPDDPIR